jgi:MSHA biogenesis protein MshQ
VNGLIEVKAGTFTSSSTYKDVQIDNGATLAGTNATTINVSGGWTNNGSYTANGNTVNFNGSSLQSIGGTNATTFNNLTLNNAAGFSLGNSETVNSALTLTAGEVATGANSLNVGSAGTVSRTSGFVTGTLQKQFSAPGAFIYHVGTTGAYTPVVSNVTAAAGGSLSVKANTGLAPLTPLPLNAGKTLQRYWSLSGSGITTDLTFDYLAGDVPVTATEANFYLVKVVGGTSAIGFQPNGTNVVLNTASHFVKVTGASSFSDWTAAEPLDPVVTSATVAGRVATASGLGIGGARVTLTGPGGEVLRAITNPFGYYSVSGAVAGRIYNVSVLHRTYAFTTRAVAVYDNPTGADFTSLP